MRIIDSMIELQGSKIIDTKTVVKRELEMAFNDCPQQVINFISEHSDCKLNPSNENHFEPAQVLLNYYKLLN